MKKLWSNIIFLRPYLEGNRLLLLLSLGSLFAVSLTAMPIPMITGKIIDNLSSPSGLASFLYQQILLILGLHFLRYLLSLVGKYYIVKVGTNASNKLRMEMIGHTVDMPMEFLDKHDKGYLMSRISESGSISSLFSPSIINIVVGIFDFLISAILLVRISLKLSLIVFAIIPLYVVVTIWYSRRINSSTREVSESSAKMSGVVFETLNGVEEIKVLGAKERYISGVYSKTHHVIRAILQQNRNINGYMEASSLISSFSGTIVLLFSGIMILGKTLTLGEYVSFTGYLAKVLGNVQAMSTFGVTINPIMVSIDRIKEYMENRNEEYGRTNVIRGSVDTIDIHNVSFSYTSMDGSRPVFENLNESMQAGDIIILNGANGSGKTTFIKLLLGLYPAQKGVIYYNGVNISTVKMSDLRSRIAYVSQNIYLFQGTILDNILLNCHHPEKIHQLNNLMERYQLHSFFSVFPDKLDTVVGHGGTNVSGGQRQMIAFLRSVLAGKEIVILDEPTANMDAETKNCVLHIIENESFYKILFIISHDPDFFSLGRRLNVGELSNQLAVNHYI